MVRDLPLIPTGLTLLGLSTLAIAMPLFETLGQGATFFVAHRADSEHILAFAIRTYLVPPILMLLLIALLRLASARLASLAASMLVALLAAAWLMTLFGGVTTSVAIPAALLGALALGIGFHRSEQLRGFLQIVGLLSPLSLAAFLWFSPTSKLINPASGLDAARVGGSDTPVVMLVLDELSQAAISAPDGSIDPARLPNFARLANMSTWYGDTTTVATHTQRAITSILSGVHTGEDMAPVHSQFPQNLFTLVAPSHQVNAIEMVSRLCPTSVCKAENKSAVRQFDGHAMYQDIQTIWWHSVLPSSLAGRWLPPISSSWKGFDSHVPPEPTGGNPKHWFGAMVLDMSANDQKRFERFLHGIATDRTTSFHYLHLSLPHTPWYYLPDGRVYNGRQTPGQSVTAYDWIENQFLIDQGAQRFSLQVEYVDTLLGQLLDTLEDTERFNETLVIVVSDHGVAFAPGELRRKPVAATLADVTRVPLFIRYPGQTNGERDDRLVQTIDILPTVADVLGIPLIDPVDGQSLVSQSFETPRRFIWEGRDADLDVEADMDMQTAINRINQVLSAGKSAMDTLAIGPGKRFYRQSIPSDTPAAEGTWLELERGEWYRDLRVNSAFVPARLTGWLRNAEPNSAIAIGVNGMVAGSGYSFGDDNEVSVMLDPTYFRRGENTISAYLVSAAGVHSVRVDDGSAPWELRRDDSGQLTSVARGEQRWVAATDAKGHAAFSQQSTALGSIGGWVFKSGAGTTAQNLLLIDDTTVLSAGFRRFPLSIHAEEHGLDEDLPHWYTLEINPAIQERGLKLSVLALFESGDFAELQLQKARQRGGN